MRVGQGERKHGANGAEFGVVFVFVFPALLWHNGHILLCKFKVYNVLI